MTAMTASLVQDNVGRIQERIAAAARRAGRQPEEITLVAVSKTHSADAIRAAYRAGIGHFGENRIQEWEAKRLGVQDLPAIWHMVGHLQSNKAARAAGLFHTVDSVDDLALAQRLDRARRDVRVSQKLRILLEVRLAEEETKTGVSPAELLALAEGVLTSPQLIPPFLENAEMVRPYFRRLRELREKLVTELGRPWPVLSMGMTHDFEVAIEEGATEVRIGTAIFGGRTR
jgi:pyridoxal phosphate enzyme (YggS family)